MSRKAMKHAELHSARSLVERLGPHPATGVGLDLDDAGDRDLGRWLALCILLGGRTGEASGRDAWRGLQKQGLDEPEGLARAGPAVTHRCLEQAGLRRSEPTAALLVRVASSLVARHDGSIDRLAAGADDLEDLAGRLARLGAGFGRAAVFRFLVPLRGRWSAAGDLPASAAVRAAAVHLGIVSELQDEEGTPSGLAHWLRNRSGAGDVPMRDLEAALDRLGRAACLRDRSNRCPLGADCPRRGGPGDGA